MPPSFAAPLAVVALVIALVALVLAFSALRRGGVVSRERPLPALTDLDSLEAYLSQQEARVEALVRTAMTQEERLAGMETRGGRAIQHVGVVRYNPFDDTGSNQSFALALLDAEGNGVVISSLHSRQQTRVYLKEIARGQSEAQLSGEETEALGRAAILR